MKFKLSITTQITIAMLLSVPFGILANYCEAENFVYNWISPFGVFFIDCLKLVAIPLIVFSLLSGFTQLNNTRKLSSLGSKTTIAYLGTTAIAAFVGIILANLVQAGKYISDKTREDLLQKFPVGETGGGFGKLSMKFLEQIIPESLFNSSTLQIIFLTIIFAIAIVSLQEKSKKSLSNLFNQLNEAVMKIIDYIMYIAPIGVFALLISVIVESPSMDLLIALLWYVMTVIGGLSILVFIFYPSLVKLVAQIDYKDFFQGLLPAQLLAISTSSSAATLPLTMDCVQRNFKIRKEIASFILPIGATINMDGTSLYQGVAAIFIAEAFGMELTFIDQCGIVLTATLASIGSAAVPGAGIIMLTVVLEQIGVPIEGLGLILAIDRPLDMLRTAVNVTSDATISILLDNKKSYRNDE